MSANISGNYNSSFGSGSLNQNLVSGNSAFCYSSLYNNTSGTNNCAFGYLAGTNNQTGTDNAIFGYSAGGVGSGTVTAKNHNLLLQN